MSISLDIANLQRLYASGEATPVDIIREVYRRIREIGERPIWITLRDEEEAIVAARAAKGPLAGMPFAVKDNIDVAGLPTTCACPAFAFTPAQSATVVQRLVDAGAIVIGKTNLDQFATGLVGVRSPYGAPSSPFHADYISGGSSSGSAVATARGLVSFALGTDTAGSGRVPAGFNNIVGLKPTKGWISTAGVFPACRSLDTVSIFALTVSDAAAVAEIAAGYDERDSFSRAAHPTTGAPSQVRVGIPAGGPEFFGDEDYRVLYEAAIARIPDLGAETVEFDFTPFAEAASLLYSGPWVAERRAALGDFFETNACDIDPTVYGIIRGGDDLSAVDAFNGMYALQARIAEAERQWRKFDVMLLPTAGTTYKIAELLAEPVRLNSNLGRTTNFVNLMDLSALAVPAGFRDDGLPFGVTLIGRAFDDMKLAAIGDRLHRAPNDAKLGATHIEVASTPSIKTTPTQQIQIAVVGAHLSGQPLNWQLQDRNARLVRTTRTAAGYSFYALPDTTPPKPGLVRDGKGAGGIEVEIWEMSDSAFGSFVALIPPPLGIGTLELEDGTSVKGFLCEAYAVAGAEDITATGGWRAWLGQRS